MPTMVPGFGRDEKGTRCESWTLPDAVSSAKSLFASCIATVLNRAGRPQKGGVSQKTCLCNTCLSLLSGSKAQVRSRRGRPCFFLYLFYYQPVVAIFKLSLKTNFYMRKLTLLISALVLGTTATMAQTVATFDDLSLPKSDTFYANYSASGTDVGFNDGDAHFPCVYDTSYGGFWSYGFAYSNMRDSVTGGFGNQYSAKTAKGYGTSNNYCVGYGVQNVIKLKGAAMGHPVSGFFVTNSTYAYNSMRDGDGFAKKFGNGDWFMLSVRGYRGGVLQPDSVGFYLANFLFPHPVDNYIVNTWKWFNLLPLGNVDSLQLTLRSTDNGMFGMNTPAYFCMDNLITTNPSLSAPAPVASIAKVYPNPATNMLYVDITDNTVEEVTMLDMAGHIINNFAASTKHLEINTTTLAPGMYVLQLTGNNQKAIVRFTKQ